LGVKIALCGVLTD